MKVKDVIYDREKKYTEVLQTELVYAKNIIKNPILFKNQNSKMNNNIKLYKYNSTNASSKNRKSIVIKGKFIL